MGLQRSDRHKRSKTGAKKGIYRKKRKFALARQPSNTKIGETRVRPIRVRGGNIKKRGLRLNTGEFTLSSHNIPLSSTITTVMYHPSDTDLMRTNTLTKGAIVKLADVETFKEKAAMCLAYLKNVDPVFFTSLEKGNLYGVINSRPGQEGKAVGRILQGEELQFYMARFKKGKAK